MKVVHIPAEEIVSDNRVPWMYDLPKDTLYYSDDGSEHTPLMQHADLFRVVSLEELHEIEERYVFGVYIPSEHKALDIEGPPNFPVDQSAEQLSPHFKKTSSVQWFQNNDYSQFPLAETQPFIFIPETQELHFGEAGTHHWKLFNKDVDHTGLYGLYNPQRNTAMLYPLDQQGNRENIDTSAENFMAARQAINSMLSRQSSWEDADELYNRLAALFVV
jgi:hypothetical protein